MSQICQWDYSQRSQDVMFKTRTDDHIAHLLLNVWTIPYSNFIQYYKSQINSKFLTKYPVHRLLLTRFLAYAIMKV